MDSIKILAVCACLFISDPSLAEVKLLDINPQDFGERSHIIDNPWWPLTPGEQMTYEGWVIDDEGEKVEHIFVDTVTDLTKTINGIRSRISLEEDYEDGNLIEQEIAFHAQDKYGNVWHLGQLRETFDEIELVGSRVWYFGEPEGAKAGIRMEAEPRVGGEALSQGYAPPPFNWTDSGRVAEMGLSVSVPAGEFSDVLLIDEWDEETDEGIFQTKYYAKGVGLVQIGYKGDDPSKEELFLTEIIQLDDAGLERARQVALAIDRRGYSYNSTSPAEIAND